MPRLPGTEDWNKAAIARTVDYLLSCVEEAPALSKEFGSTRIRDSASGREERAPFVDVRNARMELVTDAVALLLVSDDLPRAIRFLGDPGWILNGRSMEEAPGGFGAFNTNIRQFVRISLFTALAGKGQMRAKEQELAFSVAYGDLSLQWTHEAEREFLSVLPVLYSIAVASESENEVLDFLASRIVEAVRVATHTDLMDRPEFQVLGIYETSQIAGRSSLRAVTLLNPLDGFIALREMEHRYAVRVRQMRQDTYHWNEMNPAGDLVDWALLIAEFAALRSNTSRFPLNFFPLNLEVSPEMQFCYGLALALSEQVGPNRRF